MIKNLNYLLNISHTYHIPKHTINLLFQGSIVKKLLNKVNVSKQHPSATVSFQTEGVQSVTFGIFGLEETQIGLPFVADHLSTCETTYWDNHVC